MDIKLNFDEDRWLTVQKDWSAWWAGETGRPMIILPTLDTMIYTDPGEFTTEFLLHKPAADLVRYYQDRIGGAQYYGDAYPNWVPNFGPGIVSGFLGGPVHPSSEQKTVWFQVDSPRPYSELHFRYDPDNAWWRRVLELTDLAVNTWKGRIAVCHTDLGGVVDILASHRTTQQLLLDLYECPDEVIRCTREISNAWLKYYDRIFSAVAPSGRGTTSWVSLLSQGRTYMLQCDFSAMISPRMFEKFVLADLTMLCDNLDHAFYHLDGPDAVRHLDMLISIKTLRGIQWIPGAGRPGPSKWLPLLKRIRDGGKLCQVFVNAKNALTIARELGGTGFAFYIVPEEPYTDEEIIEYGNLLADPAPFLEEMKK
jgi:hypothetical protein